MKNYFKALKLDSLDELCCIYQGYRAFVGDSGGLAIMD